MKVAFYTLGCKVNQYETEVLINKFKNKGYDIVSFDDESDIYIINTCTVTNMSDRKSRNIIRHVAKKNPNSVIVVMGCYTQIKSSDVSKIEGVDIILGNTKKSDVVEIVEDYIRTKNKINLVEDINKASFETMKLDSLNTRTRAFIKIQDGCNNFCSYCIIPYARGNIRSKDINLVINEIKDLVKKEYKEVVLTGIHTGHYGKDSKDYDFSDLLNELNNIIDLKRIRISSVEITELDDKFIEVLKNNNKIVDHIHIPLQSGCDKTLKEMNRKYNTEYFYNKINEIRNIRNNISITTDVIVGFPNETEEDFNNTYEFIKKVNFSKLHVFPYSIREGTKAATMSNQVNDKTKKDRVNRLLRLSKELELNYMNKYINKDVQVLIETYNDGIIEGHTSNYILVKSKGELEDVNNIINIKINEINYPSLYGVKI